MRGQYGEDNYRLARIIYYIIWGDYKNNPYALKGFKNADDIFIKYYGGETINNYTPWLGPNGKEPKGLNIYEEEIINIFKKKYTTIGNFMVLPKQKIKWGDNNVCLNIQKGNHNYKDLPDLFYKDLFEYTDIDAKDFCLKNFLELYFDIDNDSYRAKEVFRHDLRKDDDLLNKDFILDFAKKSIAIIDYRAERICYILEERLK